MTDSPHPDSKWTHPICALDYAVMEPGRTPTTLIDDEVMTCCWCGKPTSAGIYFRADPNVVHP